MSQLVAAARAKAEPKLPTLEKLCTLTVTRYRAAHTIREGTLLMYVTAGSNVWMDEVWNEFVLN